MARNILEEVFLKLIGQAIDNDDEGSLAEVEKALAGIPLPVPTTEDEARDERLLGKLHEILAEEKARRH